MTEQTTVEEQQPEPLPRTILDDLRDLFPAAVQATASFRAEATVVVALDSLLAVLAYIKGRGYNYLEDLTAVDWPEREEAGRFDLVYQLLSLATQQTIRLKTQVAEDELAPTITTLWPGANWFEREISDLFGIEFSGHPDPRRLFMPEGWQGYPLRKDYPIIGYERGSGSGANPPVVHQYGSRPDQGPGANNNAGWSPLAIAPAAGTRAKEINREGDERASQSGQGD